MNDNSKTVVAYLSSLDEVTLKDSQTLIELMQRISSEEPKLWNVGTIGFDSYHYKYDSGREGDSQIISFYPRKGMITVYLMDGTSRYSESLQKLGKHTTKPYCVIFKRLGDVNLAVLSDILQQSYDHIKTIAKDGTIDRILWKTDR